MELSDLQCNFFVTTIFITAGKLAYVVTSIKRVTCVQLLPFTDPLNQSAVQMDL